MEMESMKEENKALRKVVEQTMKDYYDLQTKFSVIQENNNNKNKRKVIKFKFILFIVFIDYISFHFFLV